MIEVATIPSVLSNSYMEIKRRYNALSQALKIAKLYDRHDLADIINPRRTAANNDRMKCEEAVIRKMPRNTNLVRIKDDWYGIKFTDGRGKTAFKDDILRDTDLYIIHRNPREEAHLKYTDIEMLLPGVVDAQALDQFKQEIRESAYKILGELGFESPVSTPATTGVIETVAVPVVFPEEQEQPAMKTIVSTHSTKRWAERVYKLPEPKAIEYARINRKQLEDEILAGYKTADHVWTANDGSRYFFDPENMMYVVGDNPTGVGENIITLYEEDFGFTKEINRVIVFKQLEVLKSMHENLLEAESAHKLLIDSTGAKLIGVDGQIKVLKAHLELLEQEKSSLMADRDVSHKQVRLKREQHNQEFDKLFKKWEA